MALNKLTPAKVKALVQAGKQGYANDGGGLYLRIGPTGGASWVYRYIGQRGRQRYRGLGSVSAVSLSEARDRALACRAQRARGLDPVDEHRRQQHAEFSQIRQEPLANYHLTAAAPELYHALKNLRETFGPNLEHLLADQERDLLRQADAALAKARGE